MRLKLATTGADWWLRADGPAAGLVPARLRATARRDLRP
jgi:hypothetical protein